MGAGGDVAGGPAEGEDAPAEGEDDAPASDDAPAEGTDPSSPAAPGSSHGDGTVCWTGDRGAGQNENPGRLHCRRPEPYAVKTKALKIEASEKESTFPDTTDGYVVALAELGVIGGNPDGTFAPEGELTRLCEAHHGPLVLFLRRKRTRKNFAAAPSSPAANCCHIRYNRKISENRRRPRMKKETFSLLEHYMRACMGDSAHDGEHVGCPT